VDVDEPADDEALPAGETAAEVVEEPVVEEPVVELPVEEPTPDTVLAGEVADAAAVPVAPEETVQAPVADELPEPAVVVAPQPVAQPVAEDAPAVARPRRRRAASRPAGPPA
jgi:ribonuclease E